MLDSMHSAVSASILMFDPEKLVKLWQKKGYIDENLTTSPDAMMWSLFCEHYNSIQSNVKGDFEKLFRAKFEEIYENQDEGEQAPKDEQIQEIE